MIESSTFFACLKRHDITFFVGVPDSLLKNFCFYISDHAEKGRHVITANEGNAVALAAGHYLASGKPALVYMQNSGLGNAVNPLVSLLDPEIYGIPALLLIGWRGEPGTQDEPQHNKQGKITPALLTTLGIPHVVLSKGSAANLENILEKACRYMENESAPYALLVTNDCFAPYASGKKRISPYQLSREEAIQEVIARLGSKDIVVTTTGKISREFFEYRDVVNQGHEKDFLTVGSMGHASSIALGIALEKPSATVYCLDGDGAALMHMGAMGVLGAGPSNIIHIVINNGAHESVGGQPTAAPNIDFISIAKACGYKTARSVETKESLRSQLRLISAKAGPSFLEVRVYPSSRKDLGRPTTRPLENKNAFMDFLKE